MVYISKIENAKTKPSLEVLVMIAEVLDTEPGFLLKGTLLQTNENSSSPKLNLIAEAIKALDK